VAIDGRTAAGKTTLADELAVALRGLGRNAIRTGIDGFHRPRNERYARGRFSPEGYYFDARDLKALRALLLDPLGPGGAMLYRTASFDLDADAPIEVAPSRAKTDDILIVDGTFLQRPELRDCWEVVVFVDADASVATERGKVRDATLLGGEDAALALYRERYAGAFDIYGSIGQPKLNAHIVIENGTFARPAVRVQKPVK